MNEVLNALSTVVDIIWKLSLAYAAIICVGCFRRAAVLRPPALTTLTGSARLEPGTPWPRLTPPPQAEEIKEYPAAAAEDIGADPVEIIECGRCHLDITSPPTERRMSDKAVVDVFRCQNCHAEVEVPLV